MATITVMLNVTKTVATLNGTALDAILAWIEANVRSKLPADATLIVTYNINQ
jgi:hypothetical protein